jgi:hypothetical protein
MRLQWASTSVGHVYGVIDVLPKALEKVLSDSQYVMLQAASFSDPSAQANVKRLTFSACVRVADGVRMVFG